MIVPDINLLLYAHIDTFELHEPARRWWEVLLGEGSEVGVTAPVLFGYIRIATNPRVFDPPMPVDVAIGHVEHVDVPTRCPMSRSWPQAPPDRVQAPPRPGYRREPHD